MTASAVSEDARACRRVANAWLECRPGDYAGAIRVEALVDDDTPATLRATLTTPTAGYDFAEVPVHGAQTLSLHLPASPLVPPVTLRLCWEDTAEPFFVHRFASDAEIAPYRAPADPSAPEVLAAKLRVLEAEVAALRRMVFEQLGDPPMRASERGLILAEAAFLAAQSLPVTAATEATQEVSQPCVRRARRLRLVRAKQPGPRGKRR